MVDTVNPQPCPGECQLTLLDGLSARFRGAHRHPNLPGFSALKQPRHFDATRSVC